MQLPVILKAWLLCLSICLPQISAYNYLGIFYTAARSHHIVGSAFMKELASRGHEVSVISPFPLKKPIPNYHDISIPSIGNDVVGDRADLLNAINVSSIVNLLTYHNYGILTIQAVFKEASIKALLKSNQTFDAIICDILLAEPLYGLSEHFNAPLIGLSAFGAHTWTTDMVGSPSPPSYVPTFMLPFTDRMTLPQRIGNLAFITVERLYRYWYYMPQQTALYKQYFPNAKRSLTEVMQNTALVLLNQHVSLSTPRPYMPNHVEVGGLHISPTRKPLPVAMQKFIDEAEHGVIYFSMGSNLLSKNMSVVKCREFLNAFRGLKQRVFWKFENTTLEGKPNNVFIKEWFPQDDILAHPNVRAFITHGGLLSTTEAIHHGKPIIGIPIFADQFMNMARAVSEGYGIELDYRQLTATSLRTAIDRILKVPSYTQKVREMSAYYHDRPMKPMDLAVFWAEHVVRHKGARYLHCAGLDLNFVQYHNLDAIIILYGGLLAVVVLFVYLLHFAKRTIGGVIGGVKESKIKQH